ncbi:hypothetical protein CRG98_005380 [Punica granatum]|uniref:Uncharacterized protein n=1 Tax=Punica granatum TaxID=22663 RepID=A0A2I0L0N0_PUNGR|nr:hypothetical protein CRG98_005380 [Punica granatum]
MAEEIQHTRLEEDNPPTPVHSQPPMLQALLPPTPTGIPLGYSGAASVHLLLPIVQSSSNSDDFARITALEGINWASSSFTPPPEHRATVDPNPVVPPIYVSESEDVCFSAMTHVPAVCPINDPLPPPPAPTFVPLLPAAFLSADSTLHAPPPLAMPAQHPIYTVLPPTVPSMMSAPALAHTA